MNDFEKRLKESKNEIPESKINNPKELYFKSYIKKKSNKPIYKSHIKTKFNKPIFNSTLIIRLAMILLMIVTITVSSVAIYKKNQEQPIIINPIFNVIQGTINDASNSDQMMKFSSKEQLETLIKASSTESTFNFDYGVGEELDANIQGSQGPQGEKGDTGIDIDREYTTNIQEENVDEADIVKVNGDYIYYIPYSWYSAYYSDETHKNLYILKAKGDSLEVVKKINYLTQEKELGKDQNATVKEFKTTKPMDLFYTDKYLILRLQTRICDQVQYGTKKATSNYRYYTEYSIFDLNDYTIVKNIVIPGNFVSSRLIDNELYIISNYNNMKTDNIYIPRFYIDGFVKEASIDDIYYNPAMGTNLNSYVIVFKLTLEQNIKIDQFYFISSRINKVYMTENTLYLLKSSKYSADVSENQKVQVPVTQILAINVKGGMYAKGVVSVVGNVNDKYWIDEHEGYLRVASTGTQYISKIILGKYAYDTKTKVFNYITIFSTNENGKYKEISSIKEGLGEPGESMKSARFEGDVATIVTFKQTDPLYYVDISNPYNPKITSELKISGYTVYQHPYKDDYVIGIGYEADSSGRVNGYKVALFDISNENNIKQVGDSIIFSYNDKYSNLGALSNPKELFLDLENDIFGFNIMKREYSVSRYTYYDIFYTFKIDLDRDDPIYIFNEYKTLCDYKGIIDRMVFIKDKYYLLKSDSVAIYQLKKEGLVQIKTYFLN